MEIEPANELTEPSRMKLMFKLLLLIMTASLVIEIVDLLVFRYPSNLDVATEMSENLVQIAILFLFVSGYVTGPLLKEIKRRMKAETELRKSEARKRAIVDSMPDLILHISGDGTIRDAKLEHDDEFNFSVGDNITNNVGPEYAPEVMDKISVALSTGELQRLELVNVKAAAVTHHEFRFAKSGMNEVLVVIRDITTQKESEEKLIHVSNHDALTNLYNRTFYESELNRLGKSRRYPVGVIIIDLDGLKMTNDTYGHAAGDKMIVKAAGVLQNSVRGDDVIARIGGDEFAVLLPEMTADGLLETQKRITDALAQANSLNDGFELRMSMGSALAETKEKLPGSVRLADKNMYMNKAARKEALTGQHLL